MSEHAVIKSPSEIEAMRVACKLAAKCLIEAGKLVKPGISTEDINEFVHEFTIKAGATPAPLNYRGFPKSVCTSINDVVCHGIPSTKDILKEGDIINIDVTPIVDGFHGDTSATFFVGTPSPTTKKLVEVTEECLRRGIAVVKNGVRIRDIGGAIQDYAESFGFGVVRDYVGHGVGRTFHEPPQIPHYRSKGANPRVRTGMIFTIEPMINLGTYETYLEPDGWTVRTADNRLSAQFEHTILVTDEGHEILTDPKLVS
ncbi:MAG: type I methionyl aminopeptidase [Myxococcota bacterium]